MLYAKIHSILAILAQKCTKNRFVVTDMVFKVDDCTYRTCLRIPDASSCMMHTSLCMMHTSLCMNLIPKTYHL